MDASRFQIIFFVIVCSIVTVMSFMVFSPFLTVLALAATAAVVIHPVYLWFLKLYKGKTVFAALSSVIVLVVLVLLPISFLIVQLLGETKNLYDALAAGKDLGIVDFNLFLNNHLHRIVPDATIDVRAYIAEISAWVISHIGNLFSFTLEVVAKFLFGTIALFYFLKDGEIFKQGIRDLSPLPDTSDDLILHTLERTIKSVLIGTLVVAMVQGVLSGIGFTIFGLPNAILWGTVTSFAALVPGFGTSLVLAPAVVYLLFFHPGLAWLGLLVWSGFFVGLVDNFLGPKLVERGVHIHPLIILFSILGGAAFYGPEGFILGPLTISLLFALIRMYNTLITKKKFTT